MPNWCENDLTITGPEDQLAAYLEACADGGSILIFDRVIPYPLKLRQMDEARNAAEAAWDIGMRACQTKQEKDAYARTHPHPMTLGKDGFNSGGYEWCIENWGTKWPAGDWRNWQREPGRTSATFDTAWSPPVPVLVAASRKFPGLRFELAYYEAGACYQGALVCEGGRKVVDQSSEYRGERGG